MKTVTQMKILSIILALVSGISILFSWKLAVVFLFWTLLLRLGAVEEEIEIVRKEQKRHGQNLDKARHATTPYRGF